MKSQSLPHTCEETQDILCEKNHILLSCLQEMKTNTQKREKEMQHSSSPVVLVHLNKLKLIGYVDPKGLWEEEGVQVEREGNLIHDTRQATIMQTLWFYSV
jgi:hypothetical protein